MTCTIAVFEGILNRLNTGRIPSTPVKWWDPADPSHRHIKRASAVLRLLGRVLSRRLDGNPWKDAIIALIVKRLYDICRWTMCCLDWVNRVTEGLGITIGETTFGRNLIAHSWTLKCLWDVDKLIPQSLLSMPIFFDILFQYWVPGASGEVIMESVPGNDCPVLATMVLVGGCDEGRELLIQGAVGRGAAFVKLVVQGFIQRVREIAKGTTVPAKMQRLRELIRSSRQLAYLPKSSPSLRLAFTKFGYPTECSLALNTISLAVANLHDVDTDCVEALLELTHSFFCCLVLWPPQSVRNCRDAVMGGALEHLARILAIFSSCSHLGVGTKSAMSSIMMLGSHMPYVPVLNHLVDCGIPVERPEGTTANTEVSSTWRAFIQGLEVVRAVHKSQSEGCHRAICDNYSVGGNSYHIRYVVNSFNSATLNLGGCWYPNSVEGANPWFTARRAAKYKTGRNGIDLSASVRGTSDLVSTQCPDRSLRITYI